MKVLILSDIHDHLKNLDQVKEDVSGVADAAIFCGDMSAPFTAAELGKLDIPIYACLGNVDEDHIAMKEMGGENITWTPLAQEFGEVELDGKKIAFVHYPRIAELLAQMGEYDLVCHGHTHEVRNEDVAGTILLNPGPVCGIVRGQYATPSYAMYDTDTNSVEIIEF